MARLYVPDLANRPLATLSRIACRELHAKLSKERGLATANRVLKVLRAVYRSAARVYESLPTAPTIVAVDEQRIVDGKHLRGFLPSPHRLRDTFLSAAHDCNVSPLDQKALANHALPSSDITEGYIRPGQEHLREVAEKIAAFLLGKAGQRPAALAIVRGEVG